MVSYIAQHDALAAAAIGNNLLDSAPASDQRRTKTVPTRDSPPAALALLRSGDTPVARVNTGDKSVAAPIQSVPLISPKADRPYIKILYHVRDDNGVVEVLRFWHSAEVKLGFIAPLLRLPEQVHIPSSTQRHSTPKLSRRRIRSRNSLQQQPSRACHELRIGREVVAGGAVPERSEHGPLACADSGRLTCWFRFGRRDARRPHSRDGRAPFVPNSP